MFSSEEKNVDHTTDNKEGQITQNEIVKEENAEEKLSVRARRKQRKLQQKEEKLLTKRVREETNNTTKKPLTNKKIQSNSNIENHISNCSLISETVRNYIESTIKPLRYKNGEKITDNQRFIVQKPLISIIIPVFNAEKWIESCILSAIDSIISLIQFNNFPLPSLRTALSFPNLSPSNLQLLSSWISLIDVQLNINNNNNNNNNFIICPPSIVEICLFNDQSSDEGWEIVKEWSKQMNEELITISSVFSLTLSPSMLPDVEASAKYGKGCGYAKNCAINNSKGIYLCFLDADDAMTSNRLYKQLDYSLLHPDTLVGCNFFRDPLDATKRYREWHNSLNEEQIYLQQYREVTIAQPTWFLSRSIFDLVGGYNEEFPGTPEDMIFFYRWLELGGKIGKLNEELVCYRYHENATSHSVHRLVLLKERVRHFESTILDKLERITIWNAGRDGKKFFRTLSPHNKEKVIAFCDVDIKKIGSYYVDLETKRPIPITSFSTVIPPVVICVALDRTSGEFEKNLASMQWTESVDFWHLY